MLTRTGVLLAVLAPSLAAQCRDVGSRGGSGCGLSTPFGIPTLSCVGTPRIGNQSFTMSANVPCNATASLLMVGACLGTPIVIRGPFGAGGFCGPAEAVCAAFVDLTSAIAILGSPQGGSFVFSLPIPNDPALRGVTLCTQEVNVCSLPGGSCVGASHGVAITFF